MSYQKIIDLVRRVADSTGSGALDWAETEDVDVYQVSFTNYSLRVGKSLSRIGHGDEFSIEILDSMGDVVDRISDEDPEDDALRMDLYSLIKGIFESARRRAKGVDDAIDSIMLDLDILSF